MTNYNGMYESVLKLQEAYDTPTPTIYKPKKEKWVLVPKFPPTTPRHYRTNRSFEDTKRILKELDNDPIHQIMEINQFEQQKEQNRPRLVKK